MLALLAGFLLVGYLLAPGAIYRLVFSIFIPSKRFQRNRTEEVVFSALVTLLPFLLAVFLVVHTPLGRFPVLHRGGTKAAAYQYSLDAVAGKPITGHPSDEFIRALLEQSRFLFYLWAFCAVEALITGRMVSKYGDLRPGWPQRWLCDKFLLPHVSEWHVLLSRMSLPSTDCRKEVVVDVLTTQNTLYRGSLVNWFLDQDGKLAGIFLENAEHFIRDDLKRDREADRKRPMEEYWRQIPGSKLYMTSASIANYNIRYAIPVSDGEQMAVQQALALGKDVTITPLVED